MEEEVLHVDDDVCGPVRLDDGCLSHAEHRDGFGRGDCHAS